MTKNQEEMTREQKREMLKRVLESRAASSTAVAVQAADGIPESAYRFEKFPQYYQLHLQRALAEQAGIENPYFRLHEGIARDVTTIGGRRLLNFGTYNYLGLNGDPRVTEAATQAALAFGTSASASRVVSGERPPHRALERRLAEIHGTEDAVVFVSGHATNVSTISCLMGTKDLIVHDRLIHNSAVQGALLSGAARQAFPHNDWRALDGILSENRNRYEKVLILVEGLFSMDGDLCPLDRLVEIKRRHKALLMVDEAHSMGAVGATGRGIGEHFGVTGGDVDIWMGTLSKSFVGCGGYIAGCRALVELLKFSASGFVYSVGMPPPIAAASLAALDIMLQEPERVRALQSNGRFFLDYARERGLDTGLSDGINVIPVVLGRSVLTAKLANALFDRGIDVPPIIYPAVEERAARLRFFLSCLHTHEEIRQTIDAVAEESARLLAEAEQDPDSP